MARPLKNLRLGYEEKSRLVSSPWSQDVDVDDFHIYMKHIRARSSTTRAKEAGVMQAFEFEIYKYKEVLDRLQITGIEDTKT